jgi:hypothetical protein
MSKQTSGIIINDNIFINSNNVVKIDRGVENSAYTINIYMTNSESPTVLSFEKESNRDVIFNKIVKEMYGFNYAHVSF